MVSVPVNLTPATITGLAARALHEEPGVPVAVGHLDVVAARLQRADGLAAARQCRPAGCGDRGEQRAPVRRDVAPDEVALARSRRRRRRGRARPDQRVARSRGRHCEHVARRVGSARVRRDVGGARLQSRDHVLVVELLAAEDGSAADAGPGERERRRPAGIALVRVREPDEQLVDARRDGRVRRRGDAAVDRQREGAVGVVVDVDRRDSRDGRTRGRGENRRHGSCNSRPPDHAPTVTRIGFEALAKNVQVPLVRA